MIDPDSSLGELAAEAPLRCALFERLRFDYCCGGGQTLSQACEQRGLDVETVRRMLEALEETRHDQHAADARDWRQSSIGELCDHIVTSHHDRMRAELPRIEELVCTVARVHGERRSELHFLKRLFVTIRKDLESHMDSEEGVLFPACRAAEASGTEVDRDLLAAHEREHASTGDAIAALSDLTNGYDATDALCRTHGSLLEALRQFELDLHRHIHEENNILFQRARELAGASVR